MNHRNLEGIIPYLISPIDLNTGKVRKEVLSKLVEDLIDKGVHGLSPLGSTGEIHYLSWEQKKEIVETVITSTNGRVPVVPGVSAYTSTDAIEQINFFEDLGVEGIVLIIDTYFPLSKSDIIRFFREVSNSVSCPIVLYNNPRLSGIDLTPDIVSELSVEPNIQYFKDATGNTGRLLSITNNSEIKIFSASAHIPQFVMEMGGVGWMAGPACVFPEESVRLYNLIQSKRQNEAHKLQRKLWQINEAFQKYNLAACIKTALEIKGYDVGDPVSPVSPIESKGKEEIRNIIKNISII